MLWQSKKNKSAQSANLPPYRHYSSVAKYPNKINPRIAQQIKSFCYFLLSQKVESPYPLDSNPQSKVALIRSYIIYFIHCLKTRALDTSLHCVSLSMTRWGVDSRILDCFALPKASLAMTIRHALRRHCEALQTPKQSTTFMMTIRRRFTQFARFATFHTTFKGIKMQT